MRQMDALSYLQITETSISPSMQISAECRWFTSNKAAGELLQSWFFDASIHGAEQGGGGHREDCYLYDPTQMELGIKRRGANGDGVEIKGLIHVDQAVVQCGSFTSEVEVWSKWTSRALNLSSFPTVTIGKTRWMRKFDTSKSEVIEIPLGKDEQPFEKELRVARGCNVEFTEITANCGTWYSFGMEAFGQLPDVESSLRQTAKLLTSRKLPEAPDLIIANYPRWIHEKCQPNLASAPKH